MKKIFLLILFIIILFPNMSFAAEISSSANKNNFILGEDFLVQVFLDTKDVSVNAVEGTVVFPTDLLTLKEVRDGNSVVNFWVEKPHVLENGTVVFSGITTGGFSGSKGFLFSLVLEAKKEGNSSIDFNDIQILQNDGLGTKVSTTENPFTFSVSGEESGPKADLKIIDTNPPENFNPFVVSDPDMFGGKYFIVFSTVDKSSGIDHYEIQENPWFFFGIRPGKYVVAESPYLLNDQSLKSHIYVKAIDKNRNEKIVSIAAQNKLVPFEQYVIISIVLLVCIFILKKIWRKFIQK